MLFGPARGKEIAAHLILGGETEPALPSLLASLEPFVDTLIVNENSQLPDSENLRVVQASAFAERDRLVLDRTPFVDFAQARNRCLTLHAEHAAGAWVAFVDADEVHTPRATTIAAKLPTLPRTIGIVDGYTRHYFQSPDWYLAVDRRMSFFRFSKQLFWERPVHEQLCGVEGSRLCLPYVYAHYGHLASTYRHAIKERLYHSLGKGELIDDEMLRNVQQATYFAKQWPLLHRYYGEHPPAARAFIAQLRHSQAEAFAASEQHIRQAGSAWSNRLARGYWRANYALRWKSRILNIRALQTML